MHWKAVWTLHPVQDFKPCDCKMHRLENGRIKERMKHTQSIHVSNYSQHCNVASRSIHSNVSFRSQHWEFRGCRTGIFVGKMHPQCEVCICSHFPSWPYLCAAPMRRSVANSRVLRVKTKDMRNTKHQLWFVRGRWGTSSSSSSKRKLGCALLPAGADCWLTLPWEKLNDVYDDFWNMFCSGHSFGSEHRSGALWFRHGRALGLKRNKLWLNGCLFFFRFVSYMRMCSIV